MLWSFAYVPTIPNAIMPAVTFWGGTPELERLPATHPEQGWLTSEFVAAGIAPRSKHIAEWCLLRKRRVLEVLVLGASVTAGCGAHAPSPHCHPSGYRNTPPLPRLVSRAGAAVAPGWGPSGQCACSVG